MFFATGCSVGYTPVPSFFSDGVNIKSKANGYRTYDVYTGVSIASKTIENVLNELSFVKNKNYIYMSGYQIVFPSNVNVHVSNMKELKEAVETYTPYNLKFEKKPFNTVAVIAVVKPSYQIGVKKTKGTFAELLKEIADAYNADLIIEKNVEKETGKKENYELESKNAFSLKNAMENYHNLFIDYNPYNKEVKVYKYKLIREYLPGISQEDVKKFFSNLLVYNKSLNKGNTFYFSDGYVTVKTDKRNYYETVKTLESIKNATLKNVTLKVVAINADNYDEIPVNVIKTCGNMECLKEEVENYGYINSIKENNYYAKLNSKDTVFCNTDKKVYEVDYKIKLFDPIKRIYKIDYSLFIKNDKKTFLTKGSVKAPANTFIPIYIGKEEKGIADGTDYVIIKVLTKENSL